MTPQNFIDVLTGVASAGKTLKSTKDENVFVFFSDHGATVLIAFPSEQVHVAQFQQAPQTMNDKQMFNKLTFYLATCESGSIFQA